MSGSGPGGRTLTRRHLLSIAAAVSVIGAAAFLIDARDREGYGSSGYGAGTFGN